MVRIRIGDSWKHNPDYVAALRALAEGRSRGFSPREIIDTLGIEVDGVDLARGQAEAALIDATTRLLRAARSLAAADGEQRVVLAGAPVELQLVRAGEELRLTLVSAGDGATLVRDVAVDPGRFLEEARAAVRLFVEDLERIHPALARLRVVQALRREAERAADGPAPGAPAAVPAVRLSAPMGDLRLVVRDDPPRLAALSGAGRELWAPPLGAASALLELARQLSGDPEPPLPEALVRLDSGEQTVWFGAAAAPIPAAVSAVLELAEAATWADPEEAHTLAQARAMLGGSAPAVPPTAAPRRRQAAVRAALPERGLRRLLLRPAWRADAPGRRPRLRRCGNDLLVAAGGRAELRAADGERRWSAAVHEARPVRTPAAVVVVGRDRHGSLLILDSADGHRLGRIPAGLHGRLDSVHALADGGVAACDGARLVCALPGAAAPRWSFEAGSDSTLHVAGLDDGFVAATDGGELHGLDADGRVAWRTEARLDVLESVRVDPGRAVAVATGLDVHGHVALVAVGLRDGAFRWQTSLDGVRPSPPALLRHRMVLGFDTASGAALAALDCATGRVAWRTAVPDEGGAVPVAAADRILVARTGGGLCAWSPGGRMLYHSAPRDPDPALSPIRPRPPVCGAGLALVAAALVHVFDSASGRPLAMLEPAELAPDTLALLDGPVVVVAGRDGALVEAWRTGGHLTVVSLEHAGDEQKRDSE